MLEHIIKACELDQTVCKQEFRLFRLTQGCRLLYIHLCKCKSSFQADSVYVSLNMSVWWLIMDNHLSDNRHFKVLFFVPCYKPNACISTAWSVFVLFFFSPFADWQQATVQLFGLVSGQQWRRVKNGRRRKMMCSPWILQHNKVSVTHRWRGLIHDWSRM